MNISSTLKKCTTKSSPVRDYVYMLKYIDFNPKSVSSQKGQIRILTSNVKIVIKMLQNVQDEAKQSGRFEISMPRANTVDVRVSPNGNPIMIYDMLACRIEALSKEFAYPATGWKCQEKDESPIGAELVKTSQGVVEVRPVVRYTKGDSTRRLPNTEDLMKLGIVIPPEYQ